MALRVAVRTRGRGRTADEQFVASLFDEHGKALLAYATRLTGDRGAAEDIVQDTLVRAWRHASDLTERAGSVRGWLLTVARNIATDRARARKARPPEVPESPESSPRERDHAERVVDSVVVLDALEHLSPDHREVLEQVYINGLSVAETAAKLGIPAGTVKSRSYYALRMLREHFPDRTAGSEGAA